MYPMTISIQFYIKHTLSFREAEASPAESTGHPICVMTLFFTPSPPDTDLPLETCKDAAVEGCRDGAEVKTPEALQKNCDCFPTPIRQFPTSTTFSSKNYDLFLASMGTRQVQGA